MLLLMTLCIIYPGHFKEESAILHVSITNSQQSNRTTDNYPDSSCRMMLLSPLQSLICLHFPQYH